MEASPVPTLEKLFMENSMETVSASGPTVASTMAHGARAIEMAMVFTKRQMDIGMRATS